jgi:hypothetical protein
MDAELIALEAQLEFDFTKILMGHARLNKRDKESDGAAFERILTAREMASCGRPIGLQKAWHRLNPFL